MALKISSCALHEYLKQEANEICIEPKCGTPLDKSEYNTKNKWPKAKRNGMKQEVRHDEEGGMFCNLDLWQELGTETQLKQLKELQRLELELAIAAWQMAVKLAQGLARVASDFMDFN